MSSHVDETTETPMTDPQGEMRTTTGEESSSGSSAGSGSSEDDGNNENVSQASSLDEEEDSTELSKTLGDVHIEGDDHGADEDDRDSSGGRGVVLDLGDDEEDDQDSLKTVAQWLKDGTCSRVVVLSGAGVSVSAGIPDFRTPGTGLYDNLQKYNLPQPEAVFDIDFYKSNPYPFLSLAREIWPGLTHKPTVTHAFVKLLEDKGLLLRNYTQNIDGLEVMAGVSPEKVLECHGHFRTARCVECKSGYDGELCKEEIVAGPVQTINGVVAPVSPPTCPKCTGFIKPDIVFFGEGLPEKFFRLVRPDLVTCDLLIVMGTSLTVAPVSLIPEMVQGSVPRLLLNRELVGNFSPGDGWGGIGGRRDFFESGDCDDSVRKLCRLAGWEKELDKLYAACNGAYTQGTKE